MLLLIRLYIIIVVPPQICWCLGYDQKQAQWRGTNDGPGYHRIQRGFPTGPSNQPEHPVLFGPLLHEPHLHPHAHQPAQWVTVHICHDWMCTSRTRITLTFCSIIVDTTTKSRHNIQFVFKGRRLVINYYINHQLFS